jgi:hypothetical protein
VIWTNKFGSSTSFFKADQGSPVTAGVVMGEYFSFTASYYDDRIVLNLIKKIIAGFRNFGNRSCKKPEFFPDGFDLGVIYVLVEIERFAQDSSHAGDCPVIFAVYYFSYETLYFYDMSNSNLQLKILATNWGFEGTLKEYISKVKQEGYDGIEIWWPMDGREVTELAGLLNENDLQVGFLCGAQDTNYTEHFNFFKKMVEAASTNKLIRPLYINCHSGRDYFLMIRIKLL